MAADLQDLTKEQHEIIEWAYENLTGLPEKKIYRDFITGDPQPENFVVSAILVLYARQYARNYVEMRYSDYGSLAAFNDARETYIREKLFGKVGNAPNIEGPIIFDIGRNISVGDNFEASSYLRLLDWAPVRIGDDVKIGTNFTATTITHPVEAQPRIDLKKMVHPVTIGNRVIIGHNVVVLPGITIGDDVTIDSNTVVTKSVKSGSRVAGVPGKPVA